MKGKVFVGIIFFGIILLAGACSTTADTSIKNPPNSQIPSAPNKYLVTASAEDFTKANITKQVEVKTGDVFTVALDSNATTGFSWTEQAKIADGNILKQTGHEYIAPRANDDTKPAVGMSGIEEWWFTAGKTGNTNAMMSYSRPWEGGEKDARTFVLTVIVK